MKKIVKFAFVAVFAAVAGYGVYVSQKPDTMSELMLANVEALADNESSTKGTLYSTKPDVNGECQYCCCPGDRDCTSPSCSRC